ncbi:hypothetical protein [uncultured Thiodictyon sp.]|uniref:hypothetical protein n=1 Tax=uncultured Thiodictyon sp. TaxID=1846217 RepID=UPI0025E4805C|nr:hypothetical protein [uncultured Thiodictyon sp.]
MMAVNKEIALDLKAEAACLTGEFVLLFSLRNEGGISHSKSNSSVLFEPFLGSGFDILIFNYQLPTPMAPACLLRISM